MLSDIDEYRKKEKKTQKQQQKDDSYVPPITTFQQQLADSIHDINHITQKDHILLTAQFNKDQTYTITDSIYTLHNIISTLESCEANLSDTCNAQCANKGGKCSAD